MSIELEGSIFFAPSRLFTDLEDPDSRERFKGLMQFQYGFSDERADELIDNLRKELYWKKVAKDLLAVVINDKSKRSFQVGTLMGYLSGEFVVIFGDSVLERVEEDEIVFIKKSDISPQAGIKVKFLDDNWQETLQEGELIGYEKVEERKQGEPLGWYIVQVGEEIQRIKDWGFDGGNARLLVEPQGF